MIIILDGWGEQIFDDFNSINVVFMFIMDVLKKVVFFQFWVLKGNVIC